MNEAPRVFTIVLNWNGLSDTRECLDSLRKTDYSANRIIVVDNGSAEDEGAVLEQEFGGFIEVIRNPVNLGFAGGMNVGIRRALESGAEYLLLLNNDVTVEPGYLTAMVAAAGNHADLAAACPKAYFRDPPDVIYSTGGSVNLWTGTARQIGRGQRDRGQFDREDVREYADGLCMLIPAAAMETVGALDEEYFTYWEETDWCFRARKKGLRCYYVPAAKVWHKAERSLSSTDEFHYHYQRNALLFVRKRGNLMQAVTALLTHLLVYGPWYLVRRPGRIGRAVAEWRAVLWNAGYRRSQRNEPRQRPLV
ncbi:MAG TPA: glycosyltransferase family 2 protein [Dehalococcoidia bacterium]|nr:glycosyltransferase family 2 protein [Dehalococcoidia bacterium]